VKKINGWWSVREADFAEAVAVFIAVGLGNLDLIGTVEDHLPRILA
jgi:hypothetical protein